MSKLSFFWFRRDLRLEDNTGLTQALQGKYPVLLLFIFDDVILDKLPKNDARVRFIHEQLQLLNQQLQKHKASILCLKGKPIDVWQELLKKYSIAEVYANHDYEPYAVRRDNEIAQLLHGSGAHFHTFKDQVIFEKEEVVKADGKPYSVFTPYKNKWLKTFTKEDGKAVEAPNFKQLKTNTFSCPDLKELGFLQSDISTPAFNLNAVKDYAQKRDIPGEDATSHLGPHLRFGTIGIRKLFSEIPQQADVFRSELIWREFFMQILYHFPQLETENFKAQYNHIVWRNNPEEFELWKNGKTGYPMVDAGMRQLNKTGYIHNRVRMITAGFLCKHLLIDWRWGEAYFAEKLLDYDLAANNGNWQWAAGTGCDAAPYFRVFNPHEQLKKFDPELKYIRKWIEEYDTPDYPKPMVAHKFARERALGTYKKSLNQ